MQTPIGVSDFRKLIEYKDPKGNPYLFVDKSLFIKEILDDASEVKLIIRPRRFGKTLNLSMLQHFFAREVERQPTHELFQGLKIAEHKDYVNKHQGQYPVINLTFKDLKSSTFKEAYEDLKRLISKAYGEHAAVLLSSSKLTEQQKAQYQMIFDRKALDSDFKASLKELTHYLYLHYEKRPIILIDEYDTPIQTAYLEKYYKEMIPFIRGFLGEGLKDNPNLDQAVLTGILRVSKESIFSGLNNIKVYSLQHSLYGEYFGFTDAEVEQLLSKTALQGYIREVKEWYNGYQSGNTTLYNPWSIVNYIKENGKLNHYWVNTSDNLLIKNLIIHASDQLKTQLESLFQGIPLERTIDENIVFDQLETSDSALWTLLIMSGYLKIQSVHNTDQGPLYQLDIPNKEVRDLYRKMITEWLSGVNDSNVFNDFIESLLKGNMENFENHLKRMMIQTFSVHDIKGKNPEKFFHGFMLGLVACIDSNQYQIHSNKESGQGRFDIAIIPKDPSKLGIIIEIKSADTDTISHENLIELAGTALKQIDLRDYTSIISQHHIQRCLKIGVAFCGKELAVQYKI